MPATAALATSSGSASANAINAFLPPSSSMTGFTVSLAARITARPVATLPIRATLATRGWAASAAPGLGTTRDDIEDAGRQDAVDQLGVAQRRERCLLGRLDDHGIAGSERSGRLASAEHQRVVERNDAGNDAQRLPHREVDRPGAHGDGAALHLGYEPGKEVELGGAYIDVADHLANRVAPVVGFEQRKLVGVTAQDLGQPPQQPRTVKGCDCLPFAERPIGRGNGCINVLRPSVRHLAERLAGRRAERLDVAARFGRMPGAAVVEVPLGRQDGGEVASWIVRDAHHAHSAPARCVPRS